jgi:hypothetical protein
MASDYRLAIARALAMPAPDLAALPAHLRDDGTRLARAVVKAIDGREDVLPRD